jgi:hypothetical protein
MCPLLEEYMDELPLPIYSSFLQTALSQCNKYLLDPRVNERPDVMTCVKHTLDRLIQRLEYNDTETQKVWRLTMVKSCDFCDA